MGAVMRLSGRLYFFPAFLPFVELAPWVLTALGAVAGAAGFSWQKHRKLVFSAALACVIAAGGLVLYAMPVREVRIEGTRLIPPEQHPAVQLYQPALTPSGADFQAFGEIWSRAIGAQVLSSPVISGNVLIYGGYGGEIEAVSLKNGDPVWSRRQPNPVFAITSGTDGAVYAGEGLHHTQSASLTAIEGGTGKTLWAREFLGHIEEGAALDMTRNRLWTGSGPGGLWALDTNGGKILWRRELGHIDAQPLFYKKMLYVPAQADEKSHETVLHALNAGNGKVAWTLKQPGQPWGSPRIDKTGKIILTTTGKGQIGVTRDTDRGWAQGISLDGKLLWQKDLPGMPLQPSQYVEQNDTVIHVVKTGQIVALNVVDGSVAWQAEAGGELQASATLISGFAVPMLATTTYDGIFIIRNAVTGEELARRMVGKKATSSPVASGDVVYVAAAHEIRAFGGLRVLAGGR